MPRQIDHQRGGAAYRPAKSETRSYWQIFWITVLICLIQITGGLLSGSLALLSDSAHAALDGVGALISVYVASAAQRVACVQTEKVLRVRWMRVSGTLLLVSLGWIAFEAIERLQDSQPVVGWAVVVVASIGAALNVLQHRLIPHEKTETSEMQRQHVHGDLFSSLAVVAGGIGIWVTGAFWIDPVLSLGVAAFIGRNTIRMMWSGTANCHDHSH